MGLFNKIAIIMCIANLGFIISVGIYSFYHSNRPKFIIITVDPIMEETFSKTSSKTSALVRE